MIEVGNEGTEETMEYVQHKDSYGSSHTEIHIEFSETREKFQYI